MIQLPKKRPWILIALFYIVIIAGWVAFYMLAKQHSGNKRSPEEAEAMIKDPVETPTSKGQPKQESVDSKTDHD